MESNRKVRTVQSIVKDVNNGKISLKHKLQRKEGAWNKQKQSELIDSLLRPFPIDATRAVKEDNVFYIIDGVQRISTLCNFVNNQFPLSKNLTLHDADGNVIPLVVDGQERDIAGKKFKKLDEEVQNAILNAEIEVYVLTDWTDIYIREMFKRQNAGKNLSNSQLRVVKESEKVGAIIRELADNEFLRKTLGESAIRRDEDKETIRKALMLTSDFESKSFRNANLDNFISYLNNYVDNSSDNSQFECMKTVLANLKDQFTGIKIQKNSVPFVLYAAYEAEMLNIPSGKYCNWIKNFLENYMHTPGYEEFCSSGATSIDKVEGKLNYIKTEISKLK